MLHPRILFEGSLEACAKYVHIAKKWARQTYDAGIINRTYKVGSATIRIVNVIPIHPDGYGISKIWIKAGGEGGYQFFGSAEWLYKDYSDPLFPPGQRMIPRGYATDVKAISGTVKATPLVSSVEAPATAGDWVYDPDPNTTNDHLRFTPAHQPDGQGLRFHYRNWAKRKGRTIKVVGSMWASSHPCHAYGRYSAATSNSGVLNTTDVTYDYPALLYSNNTGEPYAPEMDYFRAAALQEVELPDGSLRTFGIMVDVTNNFVAFPTDVPRSYYALDVSTGAFNILPEYCQTVPCPFPSWVTLEAVGKVPELAGQETLYRLQYNWKYHPDGTKAACIAAYREDIYQDANYVSTVYHANGDIFSQPKEDYAGVIEVELVITPDTVGDGFTFEVNLLQDIYSKRDNRQPVAVGYAMIDMPDAMGNSTPIPAGSLMILEYDHYWSRWNAPRLGAPILTEPSGGTLYEFRYPRRATVAKITTQGVTIRTWLAYYVVMWDVYDELVRTDLNLPFFPMLHEFPEANLSPGQWEYNHFGYIAHLHDIDLESLSVCIGSSISTSGFAYDETMHYNENTRQMSANAGMLTVIAFNALEEQKAVGHPLLKTALVDMLNMVPGSYPNLSTMEPFYASTTFSGTEAGQPFYEGVPWPPAVPNSPGMLSYTNFTVKHGSSDPGTTYYMARAAEELTTVNTFQSHSLFPNMEQLFSPMPFTWVDNYIHIRPGTTWFFDNGGVLEKVHAMNYTDYPFGAAHHNSIVSLTTGPLGNTYTRFSVHPNKSFAIFCGPIAAHTMLMTAYSPPPGQEILITPATYEQTLVDKIVFVSSEGRTESSHIAAMNTAFKKTLTPEDYYFHFRQASDPWQVEFQPQSTDDTPHPWWRATQYVAIGIGWMVEKKQFYRRVRNYTFGSDTTADFMLAPRRHPTYFQFLTFPSPRMEGVFYTET